MSESHYMQRGVVIKSLAKSDEKPSKIFWKLRVVSGSKCISYTGVFVLGKRFKAARELVEDESVEEAPATSCTDTSVCVS